MKQSLEAVFRSRYDPKEDRLSQKRVGVQILVLGWECARLEVRKMSIKQSIHVPNKNVIDIYGY